ncbi:MAG: folylpolyglutamate synthase/dihydrofolate synthase family protein [Candidatus Promineifilaceae bacterium]|nr:folylpolyglutamate synthase/dihydrofolate synthase family protein [Candidatus Promineifilaceae bacterium]
MSSAYEEALDYLYSFVNFEHRRIDQYAPENVSLERPARLLGLLGAPQTRFRAIHIAGTKGKGSVAAMCAAVLRAAGLRVGLYTSPHLRDFRDRIRVLTPSDADGRVSETDVVALVRRLRPAVEHVADLTWFELVTAMAFDHFARQAVDVAVVEVGLGGRLDATNVLTPRVAVITSLSLDHTYLLGDTLAEIAAEKGGILKEGVPAVSAPQAAEALETLAAIATARRAPLTVIGRHWQYEVDGERPHTVRLTVTPADALAPAGTSLRLALVGAHQQENALVAVATLDQIKGHFTSLDLAALRRGLAEVVWPGRLQSLPTGPGQPALLLDSAHNADSARKLAQALDEYYQYRRLWLVLGLTIDKDMEGVLQALLPMADAVLVTTSGHPRAASPATLLAAADRLGYMAQSADSVSEALQAAWSQADPADLICVTGSIFVVGDLLNQWDHLQSRLLGPGQRESVMGQEEMEA